MPSSVVTRQYSPLWVPLVAPVRYSTFSFESFCGCQIPVLSSLTSSLVWPLRDRVIWLFDDQQLSQVWVDPTGFWWQDWYERSMKLSPSEKPSPTTEAWLFVEEVSPSTDCES